MPMPLDITLMVEPSGERVWVDTSSLVEYLRHVERAGVAQAQSALESKDALTYAGLTAVHDTIRQLADSLTVTALEAQETMRSAKRVPR